jgi:hypothetical protein
VILARIVRWGIVVALVVAFAWFVWPTPWETRHKPGAVRRHRVTGQIQVWIQDWKNGGRLAWQDITPPDGWEFPEEGSLFPD